MAKRDVFPRTEGTWIEQHLAAGEAGRAEINRHLMSIYAEPPAVYYRGTSWRWLGEAEDPVLFELASLAPSPWEELFGLAIRSEN